ncbi:MAG: S9 family peptidase, partial [Methyloligellaceae bacterium]
KETLPFGLWNSPVTTDLVAGKTLRFGGVQSNGGYLYWNEARPFEKGRSVIVRFLPEGEVEDVLPSPFSARSRVHEYGGGEFIVCDGVVFFVNAEDQDVYRMVPGQAPVRITDHPEMRFADMAYDKSFDRLIAVAEKHDDVVHHPENLLVSISMDGVIDVLDEGHDFYGFPRVDDECSQLAWIAWDLPHMPWDNAGLFLADFLEDGSVGEPRFIAGGYETAVFQPEWGPDGRLYYVSDESGIGNLYAFDGEVAESICFSPAEFGRPLWSLGTRSYVFTDEKTLIAASLKDGNLEVVQVDLDSGDVSVIDTLLRSLDHVVLVEDKVYGLGSYDGVPPGVVRLEAGVSVVRSSSELDLDAQDISVGQVLRMPSSVEDEEIFGIFYPPASAGYVAPEGDKPPLIVLVHGGPTGFADRGFKLKVQYWTSRGFAVFDLDYSGSYGYGRDYMERLNGQWGVRDVQDVKSALNYLVSQDMVNEGALFISGGSAGGFTVLLSLAELDDFAGGACSYGVADLVHLQDCTHKFEGGYLFGLMGVEAPEDWSDYDKTVFIERSPTTKAHKISKPVILFQGLDDKVVPPEQTRNMVETLKKNGRSVVSMEFPGEGHGFRAAETVKTVLEAEYRFYLTQMKLI